PFDHIRSEGKAGRLQARLMAIAAEGTRGRVYLSPLEEHSRVAESARPKDYPETDLPQQALSFRVQRYGIDKHYKLFTPRQLVALTTFSDLVREARKRVRRDAASAGLPNDDLPLADGGTGPDAYADAVATYLAITVSKMADLNATLCRWKPDRGCPVNVFSR